MKLTNNLRLQIRGDILDNSKPAQLIAENTDRIDGLIIRIRRELLLGDRSHRRLNGHLTRIDRVREEFPRLLRIDAVVKTNFTKLVWPGGQLTHYHEQTQLGYSGVHLDPEVPHHGELIRLMSDRETLRRRLKELSREIDSVLWSVTTTKKLKTVWPEIEKFVPDEAVATLAVVDTSKINANLIL